jgi:hypothetical protein
MTNIKRRHTPSIRYLVKKSCPEDQILLPTILRFLLPVCIGLLREPGSSVTIVSGYGLEDRGSIPGRGEMIFPLASVSRPALGPIQLPVQWVPGVLSPSLKLGLDVTVTTHPHLVPRSIMSRSYTPSLPSIFIAYCGTQLYRLI